MVWLARRTGLLMYGTSGLTPIAFKNIASASVLLAALWIVDFLAWTLFCNVLLTGKLRELAPLTGIAAFLGFVFATVILHYESTFLSSTFAKSAHPRVSIGIRVVLILLAAFITSLPIDMFLLDSQVKERVHQEQVLQQLPPLVRAWGAARQRVTGNTEATEATMTAGTIEERDGLNTAKSNRSQQEAVLQNVQAQRAAQQKQVHVLQRQLNQPDLTPEDQDRIERSLQRANSSLRALQQAESQQASRLEDARAQEHKAQLHLDKKEAQLKIEQINKGVEDATRYETWIHDLWNAKPLQVVNERSSDRADPLVYDGPEMEGHADIGERLIVMTDILAGKPPRRPKMTPQDRQALAEMRLESFIEGDPQAIERQQSNAASLRELSYACFLVFTFLPALIFAQKGWFEEDTRLYFDSDYQRSLGYPNMPPPTQGAPHQQVPI